MGDRSFSLDFPTVTHFELGGQHFFFLGERCQQITDIVFDQELTKDNKFVAYFA